MPSGMFKLCISTTYWTAASVSFSHEFKHFLKTGKRKHGRKIFVNCGLRLCSYAGYILKTRTQIKFSSHFQCTLFFLSL